jgi:general secretion pathway protein L
MKLFHAIAKGLTQWIDAVADTVLAVLNSLTSPRIVEFIEADNGELLLQMKEQITDLRLADTCIRIVDGVVDPAVSSSVAAILSAGRVELILQSKRFLFRPLELPSRAIGFLDGIVRAQIDRLTPWSAVDAAYGWSVPTEAGNEQITTTVAATALALIKPYVQAIASMGVRSIAVFTFWPEAGTGAIPIKVLEQNAAGALSIARTRRVLIQILAIAAFTTGTIVGGSKIVSGIIDTKQGELTRKIASARAATGAARELALASGGSDQRILVERKRHAPSSVIVLETLSQILPDHSYVTELRVETDKLRLVGVTRDAPALIELIEQSSQFTRATFFAPTTRSSSDAGERFHIEARIQPLVLPR